jgi:TetR/AcrR family transcriptional repressor of nem operon
MSSLVTPAVARARPPRADRHPGAPTAERILDAAERLVQTRGYNGFSYADVADRLGITKAALHYHFPGKAALGEALIARYTSRFQQALDRIGDHLPAPDRLRGYAELYSTVLNAKRMCLCGILAAEYETLPKPMRGAVVRFFEINQAWLASAIAAGVTDRSVILSGSPEEAAQALISGLEGAMLVARPFGDARRFRVAADQLLSSVAGVGPDSSGRPLRPWSGWLPKR